MIFVKRKSRSLMAGGLTPNNLYLAMKMKGRIRALRRGSRSTASTLHPGASHPNMQELPGTGKENIFSCAKLGRQKYSHYQRINQSYYQKVTALNSRKPKAPGLKHESLYTNVRKQTNFMTERAISLTKCNFLQGLAGLKSLTSVNGPVLEI